MITAKDIQKKKFEKVKFGYAVDEVDAFLKQIAEDLAKLEKSASESDEKIKLLAGKVREYKDTEDDLRNALIGAQKQAREVVEAANAKAAEIEAQARDRVGSVEQQAIAEQEGRLKEISAQVEQENAVLEATQRQVAEFKQTVFDMYRAHLASLAKLPDTVKPAEKAEAAKPAEPEKAEQKPAEPEKPADTEKPAEKPAEPEKPADAEKTDEKPADTEQKPEEKPAEPEKTEEQSAEDFEREAAEKAKAAAEAVRSGAKSVPDPFADGDRRSARNSGRRDDRRRRS
ncbi:MAG: DivIVA domain-containing protein [Oscillospiraceae bacterium]|nr:DivIVA domain-containing protein [Oscillospiraceae bacterium]